MAPLQPCWVFAFDGNWCRSMRRFLPTRQAHKRVDTKVSTLL